MRHRYLASLAGPRPGAVAGALALTLVALAGCSEESAGSAACGARGELRSTVQDVVDDVAEGNLGDARDELDDVREDGDELQSAVGDLAEDEREALQPRIDDLQAQLADLDQADSLEDLGARVDDLLAEADSIAGDVNEALDCS